MWERQVEGVTPSSEFYYRFENVIENNKFASIRANKIMTSVIELWVAVLV